MTAILELLALWWQRVTWSVNHANLGLEQRQAAPVPVKAYHINY